MNKHLLEFINQAQETINRLRLAASDKRYSAVNSTNMEKKKRVKVPPLGYNEKFNRELLELGFKRKNKQTFILKKDNIIAILYIGDRAHGYPYTRFYSFSIKMLLNDVCEIAHQAHEFTAPALLGSPINEYDPSIIGVKEWRLDINSTEEDYNNAIDEIMHIIRTYIFPQILRYSNKDNIIDDYECGKMNHHRHFNMGFVIPILYYQRNDFVGLKAALDHFKKIYRNCYDVYPIFADNLTKMMENKQNNR